MPPKASTRRTAAKPEDTDSTQNAPTQSAAPGASGRPSVQRLQSLKKRAPAGGSITPATRSPSVLSGDNAPKPMKFRPKAVQRRSKEEREAMEKIEQERLNDRLRDAAAIQRGRGNRGGRSSFRGRGGATGGLGGAFRGRGGGPARGRARYGITGASRDREDDSSDDDLRMSIDQINIESDEDDDLEEGKGKMPARGRREKGLRPVRVTRHEHEDRVVAVNMESSSSKSAEIREQAQKEAAEIVDDNPSPPEVGNDETRVKDEPTDDGDTPMADLPPAEDDGLLPTQKYRVRRKTSDPKSADPKPEKAKAIAPPKPKRDPRELLRTKEEIDEYDRHLDDLEHIRELLTHQEPEEEPEPELKPAEPQTVPETTPTEDPATDDPEPPIEKLANQHLLGHLFLMQFPPMTPNLSIPGAETAVEETNQPEPQAQPQVKSETEGDDVQITGETGLDAKGRSKLITAATNWSLPAGRVGKLNVHKSGRVTMDWGGISFELDRAAAVDFVQEALIVSSPEVDESGQPPKEERQQAWSMGQLSGKFTVMPDWDAML
ncbi:uncharacterized protein N7484_009768 [Penicillium longicatenatum]|uniref:uncharacterized protein n=1 Tax=Penicillium longicatenatum TaxID=1561947 RepID=UPI0025468D40|nr:uncharacterized protein N7484_009768 [Penicillium longicatenatum]KAJ5636455.1 hypothetical protein N7484_009768 [Penicillium longicatenatum]